ncbi:MAG: Holliday junction branch migration protein RuvA [Bulleidia sp.]
MIAFISGTVASYTTDLIVVDHQGMGWQIAYAHCDQVSLNQQIRVYTYMHISENEMSLFGFESMEEKQLFLRLISVKGLGPKTAMNMLSKAGYSSIVKAIENGDVTSLRKMPGIGAKSASQIVLDLKGKLVTLNAAPVKEKDTTYPPEISDALEGLKNLGYRSAELGSVGNMLLQKPGLTVEQYLKLGLQFLSKQKLGGA